MHAHVQKPLGSHLLATTTTPARPTCSARRTCATLRTRRLSGLTYWNSRVSTTSNTPRHCGATRKKASTAAVVLRVTSATLVPDDLISSISSPSPTLVLTLAEAPAGRGHRTGEGEGGGVAGGGYGCAAGARPPACGCAAWGSCCSTPPRAPDTRCSSPRGATADQQPS
jgi:hypothetical protein